MRFLCKRTDGGPNSTVWGFWLFEIKCLGSIAFLVFEDGSREAFHSHAFNAWTWFLKGRTCETTLDKDTLETTEKYCTPSLKPKYTPRSQYHKHYSIGRTYALTFRGPWAKTWQEYLPEEKLFVTLTNGRKIVGG